MVLTEGGAQSYATLIRSAFERYARIIKGNNIKVE
jgi:hypothetical protein